MRKRHVLSPPGRWLFSHCLLLRTAARINAVSRRMCLKEVRLSVDRVIFFLFLKSFGDYEGFLKVSQVNMLVHNILLIF